MATGSQAAKREKRDAAGYITGRTLHQPRCSTCMLAEKPPGTQRQTAYDLVCSLHSIGVKTHGVCRGYLLKMERPKERPAQLQFNQSGAWRSALNFDAGEAPYESLHEFLRAADSLARLSGSTHCAMRIVRCEPSSSGPTVATRDVLMSWTREKGWVVA
jgi:hypothetical protein